MSVEQPSVLYLDHLDSLTYHKVLGQASVVIDLHNVYSKLVRRTSSESRGLVRRGYLRRESQLLQKVEVRASRTADCLFCVSREEQAYFEALGARRTRLIPNGVDFEAFQTIPSGRRSGPPVILYLGDMSWTPNVKAAIFLAREVLPRLRERRADVRLRIVGRDPVTEVRVLGEIAGVEVTGAVPSIIPHLSQAHLLAVPLDSGGGTRLKILEAFAAGLPVVSTPIGCEGLDVRDGAHLLVADRAGFLDAIRMLIEDPGSADRLADHARLLARQRYDWRIIGEKLSASVYEMLTSKR